MSPGPSTNRFRHDIQGLRAIAVSLVIFFHVWPQVLPGGFVGVDVFFVISGFLITRHLLDELERTLRIDLARFWARRARRLLPAALATLLAVLGATRAFLPEHLWRETVLEVAASALYFENWLLAAASVDYLAAQHDASLVQHFWSLAVEEQFYVAWPLLLLAAFALASRHGAAHADAERRRRAMIAVIGAVTLVSLAHSIHASSKYPELAYFSTFTRAWELGAGALLAFAPGDVFRGAAASRLRVLCSWTGIAAVASSALVITPESTFPGAIALLPVGGTCLVILAAADGAHGSFSALARLRPVAALGAVSYSAYLWHWPLVLLWPAFTGTTADAFLPGATVVLCTLTLAGLSRILVEDPVLRAGSLMREPGRALAASVAGMATVVLCGVPMHRAVPSFDPSALAGIPAFASTDALRSALARTVARSEWPEIAQLPGRDAQVPEWIVDGCMSVDLAAAGALERCRYGDPDAERTAVVIGDSWAVHLLPALREALGPGWRIQVLTRTQCPVADVSVHRWGERERYAACTAHRQGTLAWIARNAPDLVVASESAHSTARRLVEPHPRAALQIAEGLSRSYADLRALDVTVLHLESPPRSNCDFTKHRDPSRCAADSWTREQREIGEAKLAVARDMGFATIDLTDWVCTDELVCPNQIGPLLVKADLGHFSGEFSRRLGIALRAQMSARGLL